MFIMNILVLLGIEKVQISSAVYSRKPNSKIEAQKQSGKKEKSNGTDSLKENTR